MLEEFNIFLGPNHSLFMLEEFNIFLGPNHILTYFCSKYFKRNMQSQTPNCKICGS